MTDAVRGTDEAMLERLNAYLDGELNAAEARDVESLLADDPKWAAELRRLERAWDLLDQLPRAEVSPDFTQSTVEMIAVSAAKDLEQARRPPSRRRWFDALLLAAGATAAALGGFLVVEQLRPKRDDAMLRDLPVLQHLDMYARTDAGESAEFLQLLRNQPPLPPPPKNEPIRRDDHDRR